MKNHTESTVTEKNTVENQSVFYGTHEALVSVDVFDKVQQIRQNRQRKTRTGYDGIGFIPLEELMKHE